MNTATDRLRPSDDVDTRRPPWFPLVLLAAIGFVLVAMETMPAGLLPVIADSVHTTEGAVGLFVSAYAIGTVVVTVPAITLTRGLRRKPLIVGSIAALLVANTVTALSPDVTIALISRFVAGSMSGVIWGMFATYARRISELRSARCWARPSPGGGPSAASASSAQSSSLSSSSSCPMPLASRSSQRRAFPSGRCSGSPASASSSP